jgi:outer membrane protein assembly factor BamB
VRRSPSASRADWPCWRGPWGSGTAPPSGRELVETLWKGRFVWKSEEPLPDTYIADSRKVVPDSQTGISGGYASPVIAGGRVYCFYYVPAGRVHDVTVTARHRLRGGKGKEKWYVEADDVLLCLDARTGRTVWKTVYKEGGLNYNAFNKGGPHLTPCVANGRLYAVGTAGKAYCADAVTGDPVWQSSIGRRADVLEHLRRAAVSQRRLIYFNRDLGSCPTVAGDAVVCGDHIEYKGGQRSEANGLVGLDADTGRRLWHVPECAGWFGSHVRWGHEGAEYIVSARHGRAVCIEPKTGSVLWEVADVYHSGSVAVADDYLVCSGGRGKAGLTCFRITPRRATKLWSLAPEYAGSLCSTVIYQGHAYAQCGAKLICVELASGKIAASMSMRGGCGSLVAADGRLFREGMHMFEADPKDFRRLGDAWPVPFANSTTPAVADGRLFFRGTDGVVCYDLRKPAAE